MKCMAVNELNGIINVLKPPGMSSHDIVYFIRKKYKLKKVGHTGTLDPEAAGVLPICIGKATKAVQYITDKNKQYRAAVTLGTETDTYDKYGSVTARTEVGFIDEEAVKIAIKQFIGVIDQIPPIYSAIKYNGKKLYQYALEGEEVELKSRRVEIFDIEIIDYTGQIIMIDVKCSKGTYIRSLCHDIGKVLGCGAHMSQLIRTESAPFNIEDSYTLEEIDKACAEGTQNSLLKPVDMIFNYPSAYIKESARSSVLNGNTLYEKGLLDEKINCDEGEMIKLYDSSDFLGLGRIIYNSDENRKYIKIEKLFI
ncbi:MAG: tRNA pseudouridine(55) synthase TruB [Bacillota bacterium]